MNTYPTTKKLLTAAQKISAICLIYAMLIICLPFGANAQITDTKVSEAQPVANGKIFKYAGNNKSRVSPALEETANNVFSQNRKGISKTKGVGTLNQQTSTPYLYANVEFTTSQAREAVFSSAKVSQIKGITVVTTVDRFADVFIATKGAFQQLKMATPGVVWVEDSGIVEAPPPPPVSASKTGSRSVPDQIVRNGFQGLRGKNVIVAVVDSGVDFRHPDFITYDAAGNPTSRLLYLWDMGTNYQTGRGTVAPVKFPNGASVGTLYTQQQLTAELRASKRTIPATDLEGHGTACASVAAGNGNADMGTGGLKRSEVVGVAPDAMIIGVSLDMGKNGGLEGAIMINAISEWLDKAAGAKPLVVSNSWGGHYTGHDGQTVSERQMNVR